MVKYSCITMCYLDTIKIQGHFYADITQITIGKNVLPIKSLLLFHNLEHYQFNYSANLCFYTSQNVIEFSAFVVQYLELCNKCTAKHSTCTGSLVSIGLMTTIHSSLFRETLDNRVAHIGVRERGATDIRQTKMTQIYPSS